MRSIGFRDKDEIYAKKLDEIAKVQGFSEYPQTDALKFSIDTAYKLILDKSSPAPNSPSGEQKPEITKTVEQKLFDQYLKDIADFKFPEPSENPEPKTESSLLSPLQWVQDHTCHFRAVVNDKGKFSIYCDTKKIPLEVCMTRQKRYVFMQKKCQPIDRPKLTPPKKHFQDQESRTRQYKDQDGYVDPFSY